MPDQTARALDRNEAELVEQSRHPADLTDQGLTELIRRLRSRRDRVQRMIRGRARDARREGQASPDAGAREKKDILVEAIERVAAEMKQRKAASAASTATDNLREAVRRKAENPTWTGPEDPSSHDPAAETPNPKIAPSGALHAEGMRAAITRSTGDR